MLILEIRFIRYQILAFFSNTLYAHSTVIHTGCMPVMSKYLVHCIATLNINIQKQRDHLVRIFYIIPKLINSFNYS